MDRGSSFRAVSATNQRRLDESDRRTMGANRIGLNRCEKFPETESWWNPTDTRQEWAPAKKDESRSLVNRDRQKTQENSTCDNLVKSEETKKSEKSCEIIVESKRRFFFNKEKITVGTVIMEDRCFIPVAKAPLKVYINCAPDRFDKLESYCKDSMFGDVSDNHRDENETGTLQKIKTKKIERIGEGQFEERIEYKYVFPDSARITFFIAMHSDKMSSPT